MTWTWFDLRDGRGVLELDTEDPGLDLKLMLWLATSDEPVPAAVWLHSAAGQPPCWFEIGLC